MALVKTCDRCGKAMKLTDEGLSSLEVTTNKHVNQIFRRDAPSHIDLCDECTDDFRKFLHDKFVP